MMSTMIYTSFPTAAEMSNSLGIKLITSVLWFQKLTSDDSIKSRGSFEVPTYTE